MKIRMRMALWAAAVIGGAMIVFGILLGALVGLTAPDDQDKELAEQAQLAADRLTASDLEGFTPSAPLIPVDVATSTSGNRRRMAGIRVASSAPCSRIGSSSRSSGPCSNR